jgi:Lsr2
MATRTQLVDDIDGTTSDDVQPYTFALKGHTYAIDLAAHNYKELAAALDPYIAAARPVTATGARRSPANKKANRAEAQAIRAWANQHNIPIADRGRIPATIRHQYNAAQAQQ